MDVVLSREELEILKVRVFPPLLMRALSASENPPITNQRA